MPSASKPTDEIRCPKCASANVVFSKKRRVNVCEDCQHEFVAEKPFDPLRLFLSNPLRLFIHGGRKRYLIVIDALDEAGEAGRNPLVEMLARNAPRLPDWLGLVVTTRPEFDVKTPLQALNPFPLNTQSESNRADIRKPRFMKQPCCS